MPSGVIIPCCRGHFNFSLNVFCCAEVMYLCGTWYGLLFVWSLYSFACQPYGKNLLKTGRFNDWQQICWQKWGEVFLTADFLTQHFCRHIFWLLPNLPVDLVRVSKSASRNTPLFLLADLVSIRKSAGRNTPPFLPTDLVIVSKSASRNTPISANRFVDNP